MNEILDSEELVPIISKRYSRLSFWAGMINVIIFILLSTNITENTMATGENLSTITLLVYSLVFTTTLGSVFTFLSFYKKESAKVFKWIGTILNFMFVLFIIAAIAVSFRGSF